MNRLQAEFQRLYLPHSPDGPAIDCGESGLIGADGRVRAMVLGLARPADWKTLSALWRGVQADLKLPAPAIAVNGIDGYQLWFSLSEPVPVAHAQAFLDGLRQRYLGNIALDRLAMLPGVDVSAPWKPCWPRWCRHCSNKPATGPPSWRRTWRPCSLTIRGWTFRQPRTGRPTCCLALKSPGPLHSGRHWTSSNRPSSRPHRMQPATPSIRGTPPGPPRAMAGPKALARGDEDPPSNSSSCRLWDCCPANIGDGR